MNDEQNNSPATFTTRVFDALKQMQDEVQRQNREMGWYDGMEHNFTEVVNDAIAFFRCKGDGRSAGAIQKLLNEYERLLKERLFSNCCMNMVGEVAEMFESFRSGTLKKPCDKAAKMEANNLPVLTAEEEEVADIVIRALDYAGRFNVDVAKAVAAKHQFNRTRGYRHGNKKA
jgi:NTP pyrophosphatase (non-canonical NTP hydrolase)